MADAIASVFEPLTEPQLSATAELGTLSTHHWNSGPHLLNEGQAAALLGVSRRTFHSLRQAPWFMEICVARELGPRALRWPRDELLLAARNAPKRVVQAEPPVLAAARARKAKAD